MKHKIFSFVMCFMLITTMFIPLTVSAKTYEEIGNPDLPVFLPDVYDGYVIVSMFGEYVLITADCEDIGLLDNGSVGFIALGCNTANLHFGSIYIINPEDGTWMQDSYFEGAENIPFDTGLVYGCDIIYSTWDIYSITEVDGDLGTVLYYPSDLSADNDNEPDMDTPETNGKTLPKGFYTFYDIDEIIFPSYEITQELNYNVPYYSLATGFVTMEYDTMTLGTNVIVYEKDGTTTIACKGVPFAQVGWVTEHYKTIYLAEPQTVSEDFEGWFWTLVANYEDAELEEPEPEEPEPTEGVYADIYGLHIDGVTYGYGGYAANMNSSNYLVTYDKYNDLYNVLAIGDNTPVFSTDNNYYRLAVGDNIPVVQYYSNGTIKTTSTISGYHSYSKSIYTDEEEYKSVSILYVTTDIVDQSGAVFFQQTPLAEKSGTLTEIIKAETLTGVLREIAIILPIGMACLISYLALRKGLRTLVQLLYRA